MYTQCHKGRTIGLFGTLGKKTPQKTNAAKMSYVAISGVSVEVPAKTKITAIFRNSSIVYCLHNIPLYWYICNRTELSFFYQQIRWTKFNHLSATKTCIYLVRPSVKMPPSIVFDTTETIYNPINTCNAFV